MDIFEQVQKDCDEIYAKAQDFIKNQKIRNKELELLRKQNDLLQEENQALKDRWDRLAQFVWEQLNNENFDKYKAFDEMMLKMQELEKEIK